MARNGRQGARIRTLASSATAMQEGPMSHATSVPVYVSVSWLTISRPLDIGRLGVQVNCSGANDDLFFYWVPSFVGRLVSYRARISPRQ